MLSFFGLDNEILFYSDFECFNNVDIRREVQLYCYKVAAGKTWIPKTG